MGRGSLQVKAILQTRSKYLEPVRNCKNITPINGYESINKSSNWTENPQKKKYKHPINNF